VKVTAKTTAQTMQPAS